MKAFGLIGRNLSHSFSRDYFLSKWKDSGEDTLYDYRNFPMEDIRELTALLDSTPDLCGFNVTIPYKESVLPFCHQLSQDVKAMGAANTILVHRKGNQYTLEAHNTDIVGFRDTLNAYPLPENRKAMILGAGGASKAVEYVLNSLHFTILHVSRNPRNAINYQMLDEQMIHNCSIIINTTPLGMYPDVNDFPNIPYEFLQPGHRLIDLIYNPQETIFLTKGKERGAITQNGLQMLISQAEAAWKLFLNLE